MFDDHTEEINGVRGRNQLNGINPESLDEDEKRELLRLGRSVQKKTEQYLTKEYDVGVSNRLVNDNVVLYVEIMCPTGDVVGMNIVPTEEDRDEAIDVEAEEEHVLASKQFVAETVNALLRQEQESPDVPVPAS